MNNKTPISSISAKSDTTVQTTTPTKTPFDESSEKYARTPTANSHEELPQKDSFDSFNLTALPAESPSNKFFQNGACAHFPCHKGIAKEQFNCMFCYCPLYVLGAECGGDYRLTERGTKDCSTCLRNHQGTEGANWVLSRLPYVLDEAARKMAPSHPLPNEQ